MAAPNLQGELWAWVQGLPPWQSDLLRRLTTLEKISEDDVKDAVRMVLAANGLADPGAATPEPIASLVAPTKSASTAIVALKDLVEVGAVEKGQSLEFEPTGLTVVFGETGSGKSSYARILRQACRSSAAPVEILPNVLKVGAAQKGTGTAVIDILTGGASLTIQRQVNAAPEAALSEVSVFDSDCALVYAGGESEITYTPSVLRLVERLGAFQTLIKKRVDEEIALLDAQQVPSDGFDKSTKAGALVFALTDNVTLATIDALTNVAAAELTELAALRKKTSAAQANDPAKAAKQLDANAIAVEKVASELDGLAKPLSDAVVAEIQELCRRQIELGEQSKALSQALTEIAATPVGGPSWKALWQAAHQHADTAPGGAPFPPSDDTPGICPLCQQPLSPPALERLRSFEQFFLGGVEKELRTTSTRLGVLKAAAASASSAAQNIAARVSILFGDDPGLEGSMAGFLNAATGRAGSIRSLDGTVLDDAVVPLPLSPAPSVTAFGKGLREKAGEQRSLAVPTAIPHPGSSIGDR